MNIKTGILAAAAVLTLTIPAAAMAQPYGGYREAPRYDYRPTYRPDWRPDWRRIEREREWRRQEELRHLRFDRGYNGYR